MKGLILILVFLCASSSALGNGAEVQSRKMSRLSKPITPATPTLPKGLLNPIYFLEVPTIPSRFDEYGNYDLELEQKNNK